MISDELTAKAETCKTLSVCLALAAAVLFVYWPVHVFDFVSLDDQRYVFENRVVTAGVTLHGIWWALFTSFYDFWHPLTWWSHMLDCELFGLNAGMHHLVNLGYHIANTLLVFGLLRQITGALWRSALAAALFGLHPLHVESVAWVSERKDVLSTFFWLLCLWSYARYSLKALPNDPQKRLYYSLALFFYVLALMAKAMVVTLPFVLILMDYWPLNRMGRGTSGILSSAKGKWPFFLLSLSSCIITYISMVRTHNIYSSHTVPWILRLTNVPVSYVRYLGATIWPADLAVMYPLPLRWEAWQWGGAVLILTAISGMVVEYRRIAPYLMTGWFSFLGTLVPTIGVVVMGEQAIADRYMYIPSIGLFVAVVWGLADLSGRWKEGAAMARSLATLVLVVLGFICHAQVQYWRNSNLLWQRCLSVTRNNAFAHNGFALYLQNSGDRQAARQHFLEALRIRPNYLDANFFLGKLLATDGETREATNYFGRALSISPTSPILHLSMGMALFKLGDYVEALPHFTETLRTSPTNTMVLNYMGRTLVKLSRFDEAIGYYQMALQVNANDADAHYYLGLEQLRRGELDQAVSNFSITMRNAPGWPDARNQLEASRNRQLLLQKPDSAEVCNNLAWLLATCPTDELRDGREAVKLAEHACELTSSGTTIYVGTLAAAYAEAGDFERAVATAQKACEMAATAGETNLLVLDQALEERFKRRQPFHGSN